MIKVNLSEGGYKSVLTTIPDSIFEAAMDFWNPRDEINSRKKGYLIFSTNKKKLYNELIPVQDKKYVFLKIRNIRKVIGNDTDLKHNIPVWCMNGQMDAFYNNSNDDPKTTEIFGLERDDLKELRYLNFNSYEDDRNIRINAVLYSKNGKNKVYFYLTKDIEELSENGVVLINKPGTSGVKVPKGSA